MLDTPPLILQPAMQERDARSGHCLMCRYDDVVECCAIWHPSELSRRCRRIAQAGYLDTGA